MFLSADRDGDAKVYIYSSTGAYQSNFSLHNDNANGFGITTYNNQFYITDRCR